MVNTDCIFCKILSGQLPAQVIWQDDDVLVIKDIHPKAPIHYLILPKKHGSSIQDVTNFNEKIVKKLFVEVPALLADSVTKDPNFNLVVNNGAQAGQVVFHLHIHFLAGKKLSAL